MSHMAVVLLQAGPGGSSRAGNVSAVEVAAVSRFAATSWNAIIESRIRGVKRGTTRPWPEVVAAHRGCLLQSIHAHYAEPGRRWWLPWRSLRWPAACSAPASSRPRTKSRRATASSPRRSPRSKRSTSGKVESDRLVYSAINGMLQHARSAFELLRSAQLRADARAPGRPLLRPRHQHPVDRRRHPRRQRLRGLAGLPPRHPARRHHRQDRGRERQGLGRATRRSSQAEGPEGHVGQGVDQAPRLRRADRADRRARRGQHPDACRARS